MSKKTLINFQADTDLAKEFKRVCEKQGLTQSLVLRELMKDYLKKNKQPDLLNKD